MQIHGYREEDFGYVVAFREGQIGLYARDVGSLCTSGADLEVLARHKLKEITITPDFHLRSPLIVWLEVTRACNLRCPHCFTASGELGGDDLSTDQILSLLHELKAKNVFCIVFSGGEPLLRDDLLEIVGCASRLGFVISVVTNGLLLTDSLVHRFPRNNVRVTISLDNLHLGGEEGLKWSRRLSFLKGRLLLLQKEGVACNVSSVMTRENLPLLKTIFAWLVERGIPFRTIPFAPIGRGALYPDLRLRSSETKQAAELWAMELANEQALMEEHPCLTFSQFLDYALTLVYMARACEGGRFIAYICANGDVYPCPICAGANAYLAGNIRKCSFYEIWENSLKGFRQMTSWNNFPECQNCRFSSAEYFCTSRCPPLALLYRGSPRACGATAYDRASLAYRTRLLHSIKNAQ